MKLILILLVCILTFIFCKDYIKQAKGEIKNTRTQLKPLNEWINKPENKLKYYPEGVFYKTTTKGIRKNKLKLIKLIKRQQKWLLKVFFFKILKRLEN